MVSNDIHISLATTDDDLKQILHLQALNHKSNLSPEQALKNGFVTVRHTESLLKTICQPYHHIIAKLDDKVVGYALVMLSRYSNLVPELQMMDDLLNKLYYTNKPMRTFKYVIMGQICIAEEVRGKRVFDDLYGYMSTYLKNHFDFIITEVAERNQRSMKAHQRVGFHTIHTYHEESIDEVWNVVILPLSGN